MEAPPLPPCLSRVISLLSRSAPFLPLASRQAALRALQAEMRDLLNSGGGAGNSAATPDDYDVYGVGSGGNEELATPCHGQASPRLPSSFALDSLA